MSVRSERQSTAGALQIRHHVIIADEPGFVVVYGSEDNGRYIEHVDKSTGKTIYNKKLPPDGSAH